MFFLITRTCDCRNGLQHAGSEFFETPPSPHRNEVDDGGTAPLGLPIGWMVRINRPTISPDVALVTVCFLLFLARAVTVLAQGL
jgi:hypothetical protein